MTISEIVARLQKLAYWWQDAILDNGVTHGCGTVVRHSTKRCIEGVIAALEQQAQEIAELKELREADRDEMRVMDKDRVAIRAERDALLADIRAWVEATDRWVAAQNEDGEIDANKDICAAEARLRARVEGT